jgi:hypothetical protein
VVVCVKDGSLAGNSIIPIKVSRYLAHSTIMLIMCVCVCVYEQEK